MVREDTSPGRFEKRALKAVLPESLLLHTARPHIRFRLRFALAVRSNHHQRLTGMPASALMQTQSRY